MTVVETRDRTEYGQLFKWNPESCEWETTTGRKIFVKFVGEFGTTWWFVRVPHAREEHQLVGDDAEQRAFCVAESYSRQQS